MLIGVVDIIAILNLTGFAVVISFLPNGLSNAIASPIPTPIIAATGSKPSENIALDDPRVTVSHTPARFAPGKSRCVKKKLDIVNPVVIISYLNINSRGSSR
jgi:hypothetical protein